jgi:hypothetical protein
MSLRTPLLDKARYAVQQYLDIGDTRPGILNDDEKALRAAIRYLKPDNPSLAVLQCIAGNFRDGGRDTSLFLRFKPQQFGDLPGTLACRHDIVLRPYIGSEK